MNAHEDDGTCERCGKPVHLLHNPPCEHGICICDTCDPADVCDDCHRNAEAEMFETGAYNPAADPLYKPRIPRAERWCPIHRRTGCPCSYGDSA